MSNNKERNMALTDKIEIPRRTMVLFFVIDASAAGRQA
jgi:hypothetical protein